MEENRAEEEDEEEGDEAVLIYLTEVLVMQTNNIKTEAVEEGSGSGG